MPSISPTCLLSFDDLDPLLDAVMLFGASLCQGAGKDGSQVSISISRHRAHWASLAWIVLILENNDSRLFRFHVTFSDGPNGPKAVACTHVCQFFAPAFRRWYPKCAGHVRGQPVTPHGITLTPHALAFWTVDTLIHAPPASSTQPLLFDAPNLDEQTSAILASQIRELTGWKVQAQENEGRFTIQAPQAARSAIEAWTSAFAPPVVWNVRQTKGNPACS
jgi:hypothetical protein